MILSYLPHTHYQTPTHTSLCPTLTHQAPSHREDFQTYTDASRLHTHTHTHAHTHPRGQPLNTLSILTAHTRQQTHLTSLSPTRAGLSCSMISLTISVCVQLIYWYPVRGGPLPISPLPLGCLQRVLIKPPQGGGHLRAGTVLAPCPQGGRPPTSTAVISPVQ